MYGEDSFANTVNFKTGELVICGNHSTVHLSKIRDLFKYQDEIKRILEKDDLIIYETYYPDIEENEMYLFYGITKIHPGRIGKEFFMTRGHIHKPEVMSETYTCLSGKGMLLVQKDKKIKKIPMTPGTIAYVGPYSMHRTYNTGNEPFIFITSIRADYMHDYSILENPGFVDTVTVDDID